MSRKTGKDTKIEVEVGASFYSLAELSTVTDPAGDVGKVWPVAAQFISDQDDLQPVVRLDGVIYGLNIAPSSSYNAVSVAAGAVYVKGIKVNVQADEIAGLQRPTTIGHVKVYAIQVNGTGTISKRATAAGAPSANRGVTGGKPYIAVDEVLLGYVYMSYYAASASGASLVLATEIDSESKERTFSPEYKVNYHDIDLNNGSIEFATALPLIHCATATAGAGTDRRNVFVSYYSPEFEELPDSKDFAFNEDVASSKSQAYRDDSEQAHIGIESWSGSGTCYWDKTNDILALVKGTKRWIKYIPDIDLTDYFAGRAIVKVNRTLPTSDAFTAAVTLEGSGKLFSIAI